MTVEESRFGEILEVLARRNVPFIVIGGLAGIAHGSSRATFDVDVVYSRQPEDLPRLVNAIADYQPYLRGAPAGLPFSWDVRTL